MRKTKQKTGSFTPITLSIDEAVIASVALTQLPKIHNFDVKWDLARIRDMIQDELKPLQGEEHALIEEHGGALDGASITWPEDRTPENEDEDDAAERMELRKRRVATYTKARAALGSKEITINRRALKRSEVRGTDPERQPDFTVEQLSRLRKIIVDDDGR